MKHITKKKYKVFSGWFKQSVRNTGYKRDRKQTDRKINIVNFTLRIYILRNLMIFRI